jgi:aspartate carbamoyltransferase catalytic subunit
MMELGGNVLGFSDAKNSSVSKGETCADTSKVISCFADIIAMRHFEEGAALVAAMNATVPVINAGDGSHSHPTQTLTDLLTIKREIGRFDNLTIGFCGDLRFGRTVHSLIKAMSRYEGVKVVLIAPEQLRLPSYMKQEVCDKNNIPYVEVSSMEEVMDQLDVLYMTRVQKERFLDEDEFDRLKDSFILDPAKLKNARPEMRILHPLPRVNEITVEVDDDPRAAYFRQVENGEFVRMALILKLLEWAKDDSKTIDLIPEDTVRHEYVCSNKRCISNMENVDTLFRPRTDKPGKYRCVYCESKAKLDA